MATEAKKLQVGGFVLVAIVLTLAMLVWVGSTRLFSRTVEVATYVGTSVQGLEVGAPVKYRGVGVGQVRRIDIAPDPALIEVVMSLDRAHTDLLLGDPTMRARLQLVGITGVRYVELAPAEGRELDAHPVLTFVPRYPVIPSAPSLFDALADRVVDILDGIAAVDMEGLAQDLRRVLDRAARLLEDERIQATLSNIEETTRTTSLIASDIHRVTSGRRLERIVADMEGMAAEARALVTDFREGAAGEQLRVALTGMADLTVRADALLTSIGRDAALLSTNGRSVMGELAQTLARVDVVLGEVEAATRVVGDRPSLLLFAEQPTPTRPGGGGGR